MKKLPEELLEAIVEHLACNTSFIESQLLEYRSKYASSELLSLSLASRQWRRLCVSFLFSYLEIPTEDTQRFFDLCSTPDTIAPLVRTLTVVGARPASPRLFHQTEQTANALIRTLPRLINLSQINFESFALDVCLYTALQSHPVSRIIIDGTYSLRMVMDDDPDLSKVIVQRALEYGGSLTPYLSRGLQVKEVYYMAPNTSLLQKFHGLSHLELTLTVALSGMSWLIQFHVTHPLLRKITFTNTIVFWSHIQDETSRSPFPFAFILPFIRDLEKEGLGDALRLIAFTITRKNLVSGLITSLDVHDWEVTGLNLHLHGGSTSRVFDITHASFQKLSMLSVHFWDPGPDNIYAPIHGLFVALAQLSSLRALKLHGILRYLDFVDQMVPSEVRSLLTESIMFHPADVEAVMIWYMTCVANKLPSIEVFYVEEYGYLPASATVPIEPPSRWSVQGWIDSHRLRNISGCQDMVGTLNFTPRTENPKFNTVGYHDPKYFWRHISI